MTKPDGERKKIHEFFIERVGSCEIGTIAHKLLLDLRLLRLLWIFLFSLKAIAKMLSKILCVYGAADGMFYGRPTLPVMSEELGRWTNRRPAPHCTQCCALCPGAVNWHNCGSVLGVWEFG